LKEQCACGWHRRVILIFGAELPYCPLADAQIVLHNLHQEIPRGEIRKRLVVNPTVALANPIVNDKGR
jgi:hypothetical protein